MRAPRLRSIAAPAAALFLIVAAAGASPPETESTSFHSAEGHFHLTTGPAWQAIPNALLDQRMPSPAGQPGVRAGFSRTGSRDPLAPPYFLVRSERQDIYPDTPGELLARIEDAAPPGLLGPEYDADRRLLTFGDRIDGTAANAPGGLRRLHAVFLGRERAVTFTFVSQAEAYATFEAEFRRVLSGFSFEDGHGGDRFARARKLTLIGIAFVALLIGAYFSWRWRRFRGGGAG